MTSRTMWLLSALLIAVGTACQIGHADAVGLPASAKLLDDNVVMYLRPVPLTSPDGKHVAFVSRGFVCVADLERNNTRKLVEVPGTWSQVFARTEEAKNGGGPDSLMRALGGDKCNVLQAKVASEIGEFQWTFDSSAIVFGVHSYDAAKKMQELNFWRVALDGTAAIIASNERSLTSRRGPGGTITRDERFLVANCGRERSLIWDLAKNSPRATPYLFLAPSPSSDRWLGV